LIVSGIIVPSWFFSAFYCAMRCGDNRSARRIAVDALAGHSHASAAKPGVGHAHAFGMKGRGSQHLPDEDVQAIVINLHLGAKARSLSRPRRCSFRRRRYSW